jgi:hypothetical protein
MSIRNYYNGSFMGVTFLTSYSPTIPESTSYDTVTFYGGNTNRGGYNIDKVYGTNTPLTKSQIDSYSNTNFNPQWTTDTYLLCEFDGSVSGGNVSSISSPILNWMIYREEEGTNVLKQIDKIDVLEEEYIDFTALKNKKYKYYLFGQNNTEISAPLTTSTIEPYYHGWYLIDVENKISYMFDLDLTGGDISQVENISEYETNLPYNAYSRGATNHIEGSITALVMDDLCSMKQDVELLNELRDFIFSDRLKYLKDNKGRIFRVFTSEYKDNLITAGINGEPRYVSFSFKEVGEV